MGFAIFTKRNHEFFAFLPEIRQNPCSLHQMVVYFVKNQPKEEPMDKNGSLDKALKVLDLFIAHPQLSMSQVAKYMGYSTSATQRILVTLESNQYLYRGEDGLYRVAYKVMLLGEQVGVNKQLVAVATDIINGLSEQLGFAVNVSAMDGKGMLVAIARSNSTQTRYLMPNIGTAGAPENSASGKLMLCAHPQRQQILPTLRYFPYTPQSILSQEKLSQEFTAIEATGFSYDNEELVEGLYCVATRIPLQGEGLYALSVSGYKLAMLERLDSIKEALRQGALEIQQHMQV